MGFNQIEHKKLITIVKLTNVLQSNGTSSLFITYLPPTYNLTTYLPTNPSTYLLTYPPTYLPIDYLPITYLLPPIYHGPTIYLPTCLLLYNLPNYNCIIPIIYLLPKSQLTFTSFPSYNLPTSSSFLFTYPTYL